MKKKGLIIVILLLLVGIQFVPVDKTNPRVKPYLNYVSVTDAPREVEEIIKRSCYDCHSNETKYPWYANVAPMSWVIKSHVDKGREELNFSEWGNYPEEEAKQKQKECFIEITNASMPKTTYTILHSKAKLTSDQVLLLQKWFTSQKKEKPKSQPYEMSV